MVLLRGRGVSMDKGHESYRQKTLRSPGSGHRAEQPQILMLVPQRNDEPPSVGKLLFQGVGQLLRGRRGQYRIEGRLPGPALAAVSDRVGDVEVAQSAEERLRPAR